MTRDVDLTSELDSGPPQGPQQNNPHPFTLTNVSRNPLELGNGGGDRGEVYRNCTFRKTDSLEGTCFSPDEIFNETLTLPGEGEKIKSRSKIEKFYYVEKRNNKI